MEQDVSDDEAFRGYKLLKPLESVLEEDFSESDTPRSKKTVCNKHKINEVLEEETSITSSKRSSVVNAEDPFDEVVRNGKGKLGANFK